ncbi:SCO7613 C-terminal domain-containing membrane protein [Nocardioides lianchengensis]|uniref:Uncharacterized protein n=1 Tax=Nocardioides lianchengensis TaxID=1045774 RepID=A0A1G6K2F2_9ACTN|nr:hypothetical protein [Nocardioides lianchengensis]NYG08862.1 hypothetical protein [Nocardioides lianchengensis]SDC25154.1 hypothetical protein SAMN05421872_101664 [Nocardioides lianchengensis]
MRFYDPTRCPDCGAELPAPPAHADACPACDLRLTGQTAVQLQSALRYADQLLAQLRRPAPVAAAPYPAPAVAAPVSRGPRVSSVPAVLLGLGALCLLVAAMVFLAVAWSWLGVGGRTAVLVGLTAGSGAAGLLLGGRGLRVAAEALSVVALGLVLLDVAGAGRAGWLGTHAGGVPPEAYGVALAVAGLLLLAHPLRLVAPQLAVGAGLGTVVAAQAADGDQVRLILLAGVLSYAALAWLGRLLVARALPWVALAGGALCWTALLVTGLLVAADHPSLRSLWLGGGAVTLLAAAALLALPVAFLPTLRPLLLGCLALAATVLTGVLLLPAVDESATVQLLAAAAASLGWSAAAVVLPRRWREPVLPSVVLLALPLASAVLTLAGEAAVRATTLGAPFTQDAQVRLAPSVGDPHPVVLLAAAVALLAAGLAGLPAAERPRLLRWAAAPLALLALATVALTAVPLALVVLVLAVLGLIALLVRGPGPAAVGLGLLVAAVLVALPSAALTTGAAVSLAAAAGLLALRADATSRVLGGAGLPPAVATVIWAGGEVAGLDPTYRSLLVLVVVAALAVPRPRPEVEVAALLAALAAAAGGIHTSTELAVHLTLAGGLVTTSALLHRDRRLLAWPGGLLLAAATWVRLAEIGVVAPEAYTLPSALALVAVGLHRLLRHPDSDTSTALLPGLGLATVPTLAWVLADPIGPRAVLLGAGCLALVLLGARLRWSAPLMVGAVVGSVVVLREAAPYLAETPQWVLIGTAGALLTVVGVTWERRVVELRRAGTYVGRLR